MSEAGPYEPPRAAPEPPARGGDHGYFLKWIYLVLTLAGPIAYVATSPLPAAVVILFTRGLGIVVGILWVFFAWSSVPPPDRGYTRLGKITAFGAVLRLLFPIYNLYFTFVAPLMLSAAINDSLARREMPTRAPAFPALGAIFAFGFAIVVTPFERFDPEAGQRAPYLSLLLYWLSMVLWFAYMRYVDVARRIMVLSYLAERSAVRAQPPKPIPVGVAEVKPGETRPRLKMN